MQKHMCAAGRHVMMVTRYSVILYFFRSVLKTFIHDPLVEWEKVKGRQTTPEATNEKVRGFILSTFYLVYIFRLLR